MVTPCRPSNLFESAPGLWGGVALFAFAVMLTLKRWTCDWAGASSSAGRSAVFAMKHAPRAKAVNVVAPRARFHMRLSTLDLPGRFSASSKNLRGRVDCSEVRLGTALVIVLTCNLACCDPAVSPPAQDGGLTAPDLGFPGGDAGIPEVDAGPVADAGTCTDYCDCVALRCVTMAGYPFPDRPSCMTACGGYDGTEFTCLARWCRFVRLSPPDMRQHWCEHAWGLHALDECQ
jgi:hypothetical protein